MHPIPSMHLTSFRLNLYTISPPSHHNLTTISPPSYYTLQKLPKSVTVLLATLLICLSALVVNSVATPFFLIAGIPLVIIYTVLQNFFRATSRSVHNWLP
jgi:hypothetical protein